MEMGMKLHVELKQCLDFCHENNQMLHLFWDIGITWFLGKTGNWSLRILCNLQISSSLRADWLRWPDWRALLDLNWSIIDAFLSPPLRTVFVPLPHSRTILLVSYNVNDILASSFPAVLPHPPLKCWHLTPALVRLHFLFFGFIQIIHFFRPFHLRKFHVPFHVITKLPWTPFSLQG